MTQTNTGAGVGGASEDPRDRRRKLDEHNRARVAAMYQGRPDHEKFTALMLMRAVDPEETAGVLDTIRGAGTDLQKRVPGADNRPLRHFVNKSRAQLMREFADDEAKVSAVYDALRAAGMEVSDEQQRETTAADETETRAARPTRAAQPTMTATGGVIGAGATAQRAFGAEQVPADEVWHLSDEELMGVEGISGADVVEIRRLQRENAERSRVPAGVSVSGVPLAPAVPGEGGDAMRTGLTEPGPDVGGVSGNGAAPPVGATETGGKGKGKGKAGKGGETPTPATTPTPTPTPANANPPATA